MSNHIVEMHMKELDHVDYVNTFESLKASYEQDRLKDRTSGFEGYVMYVQPNHFLSFIPFLSLAGFVCVLHSFKIRNQLMTFPGLLRI